MPTEVRPDSPSACSRSPRFPVLTIVRAIGFVLAASTASAEECGDVDNNGKVAASDALFVLQKAVGIDVELLCTGDCVAIEARVAALEAKTDCMTVEDTTTRFEGCNVQVVNGTGSTAGNPNGLGNLVVGYDLGQSDEKTGSHNFVVGDLHQYLSYGGLVAGYSNRVDAPHASVTGGYENEASASYAVVSGGNENHAEAEGSTVSGGRANRTEGSGTSVFGGSGNKAAGVETTVAGGAGNYAGGLCGETNSFCAVNADCPAGGDVCTPSTGTSVCGGSFNYANGNYSSIAGGSEGVTRGAFSSICGGLSNVAAGESSSVSGGYNNQASGYRAAVSGGRNGRASGDYSTVIGGMGNVADSTDQIAP